MRISWCVTFVLTLTPEACSFVPLPSRVERRSIHAKKLPFSFYTSFLPSTTTSTSMRLYLQPSSLESSKYLVRVVFLRALAFVYGVAFTVAYKQNKALIGDAGLTPARHVLDQAEARANDKQKQRQGWIAGRNMMGPSKDPNRNLPVVETISLRLNKNRFFQRLRHFWDHSDTSNRPVTTILWLVKDRSKLNSWLDRIALCGIGMAAVVFILGAANLPLLLALWVCQRSLWAVGGPWYGYGWEPQLAELGFHSLFLVPLWSLKPFASPAVPAVVAWSMRWFLVRIMIGAGLIKLKGGKEWKDLTAMYHHYETQPIPNPLSRYFHNAPKWWHRWEVITNHFVELIAPWMLLLPFRRLRITGGLIQIIFQAVLILSGNLSFLNWLTAVPAIFCLDDAVLMPLFSSSRVATAKIASLIDASAHPVSTTRRAVNVLYGLIVSILSVPVVRNLCSRQQVMNGSFDPLRLVNTYGAFGTVASERTELIVSSALDAAGEWREYEFPAKPSDVNKPPRWISPYHYRLDWQMWIAVQLGSVNRSPWMFTLLKKLFEGDDGVLTTLLGKDPWEGQRPKYIRIDRYRYKFYPLERGRKGPYWEREYVGRWYPRQGVCTLESLQSDEILSSTRR